MKLNKYSAALLILTFLAQVIGLWFYQSQLSATPAWLWNFVPDCPLYALLAVPIIVFGFPKSPITRFLIASGLAIYGSWTIFVLLLYSDYYFAASQAAISIVLILGHAGMILEAFLVMPKLGREKITALLAAFLWFLLNLKLDYFIGDASTHPWIPAAKLDTVILFTAAASILWPLALAFFSGKIAENKLLGKMREKLAAN